MTVEQFYEFWTSNYGETIPISHYFKYDYAHRWFRIHNLPESKRYADNVKEWEILLFRQNTIITDLFGENTNVLLVTGEYNDDSPNVTQITEVEPCFKDYSFAILERINLYELSPDVYYEGQTYRPAFSETIWNSNRHDALLKEIANDNTRAFFVSPEKKIIVAPYDGGIDFIVEDMPTRNTYKQKYKEWLSEREDGF